MAFTDFEQSQKVAGLLNTNDAYAAIDTYYMGMPLKYKCTPTAVVAGTGNGTCTALSADRTVKPGTYVFTFSGASAGNLRNADGALMATLTLVTAEKVCVDGLAFTWTAGLTPHISGDTITITVGSAGEYVYEAGAPETLAWESKTLSSAGYLLVLKPTSEVLDSVVVNDSGATLTVTNEMRASLANNGIVLRNN